ncbi:hypothetical protein [Streptomyces cavernae]|uniref:hypothetical protein n=1 Tax=Streptomyces cavernae TaxID=2259034 RepID=UPI000FEBEA9C|nr:hypothetical protein [Streptomyces cavernae]
MRFSPDDVVFRVSCNLEQVSTAEAALRAWLPLVAELRPRAVEFAEADPDGLRRGFLADLLVVSPLAGAGQPADRLRATAGPLAERLGLDAAGFEVDEEGTGGVASLKAVTGEGSEAVTGEGSEAVAGEGEGAPYGAYLLLAMIGADPSNPEGDEADYEDTGEDLI